MNKHIDPKLPEQLRTLWESKYDAACAQILRDVETAMNKWAAQAGMSVEEWAQHWTYRIDFTSHESKLLELTYKIVAVPLNPYL